MELTTFIQSLVSEGKVSVKGVLIDFGNDDLLQTSVFLEQYYKEDALDMPYSAPSFSPDAAVWAAKYLYTAVQLTVLRDEDEGVVTEKLKRFPDIISHENIYSVDLVFRYLKTLFDLAKGLSPADILIHQLKNVAKQWPFSTVGMELEEFDDDAIIFLHPSLKQVYIDRIIEQKDTTRIKKEEVKVYVLESTGEFSDLFWPDLETQII